MRKFFNIDSVKEVKVGALDHRYKENTDSLRAIGNYLKFNYEVLKSSIPFYA
jgi:hypothetical protein